MHLRVHIGWIFELARIDLWLLFQVSPFPFFLKKKHIWFHKMYWNMIIDSWAVLTIMTGWMGRKSMLALFLGWHSCSLASWVQNGRSLILWFAGFTFVSCKEESQYLLMPTFICFLIFKRMLNKTTEGPFHPGLNLSYAQYIYMQINQVVLKIRLLVWTTFVPCLHAMEKTV